VGEPLARGLGVGGSGVEVEEIDVVVVVIICGVNIVVDVVSAGKGVVEPIGGNLVRIGWRFLGGCSCCCCYVKW